MQFKKEIEYSNFWLSYPHSKPPCNEFVGWYANAFLMLYKYTKQKDYRNRLLDHINFKQDLRKFIV